MYISDGSALLPIVYVILMVLSVLFLFFLEAIGKAIIQFAVQGESRHFVSILQRRRRKRRFSFGRIKTEKKATFLFLLHED
jgi:hypothetical protein